MTLGSSGGSAMWQSDKGCEPHDPVCSVPVIRTGAWMPALKIAEPCALMRNRQRSCTLTCWTWRFCVL